MGYDKLTASSIIPYCSKRSRRVSSVVCHARPLYCSRTVVVSGIEGTDLDQHAKFDNHKPNK